MAEKQHDAPASSATTEPPASALGELFERFSRATADLVGSHEVLLAQVETLKRELAAKNRRLEHKKRLEALGRVAAGIAHEFRNPLGGIRLTVDALLSEEGPAERTRERLAHIQRAVQHLDRIVDDLLTFTREERLEPTPVRAAELVEAAIEMAFPDRGARPTGLVAGGPAECRLEVDRHAFLQVLVNLLSNAAHAARQGSDRVGVWWGARDGGLWLEVADDGPGIPRGEEERIFHPFYSLREGGTGLGLAIVHSRIEAHDGEIQLVDTPWGAGSSWGGARFRILLPGAECPKER